MELLNAAFSELLQMPWQGALFFIAATVLMCLSFLFFWACYFSVKPADPKDETCPCQLRQGIDPLTMAPFRD